MQLISSDSTLNVSVLLPTRSRTEQLLKSLNSLLTTVSNTSDIEILLAFDNDDTESFEYFNNEIIPELEKYGVSYKALKFPPLGYPRLNQYVNHLAGHARGQWLFFWNDDAEMQTQDWDIEFSKWDGHFRVLAVHTHNEHPYSIFPIVPVEWFKLLGYLSSHPLNNAEISQIAYILGIFERIDVWVEHDRFDLTGNNHGDTFESRRLLEGNPAQPGDIAHKDARAKRYQMADRIAWFLKIQGESVKPWIDFLTGDRDPWKDIMAADINNQMHLVDLKKHDQKK